MSSATRFVILQQLCVGGGGGGITQAHTPPASTTPERTPPAKRMPPTTIKEHVMRTHDPRSDGAQGWTAGTTHGGVGHLGLTHMETRRSRLWTTGGRRCMGSKNRQTTPQQPAQPEGARCKTIVCPSDVLSCCMCFAYPPPPAQARDCLSMATNRAASLRLNTLMAAAPPFCPNKRSEVCDGCDRCDAGG